MCWDGIKIEALSTTGWKVKSNMEEMPNDLEKEKDPTALVKKLWGVYDQRDLSLLIDAISSKAPLEWADEHIRAETWTNSKKNHPDGPRRFCVHESAGSLCRWLHQGCSTNKSENLAWLSVPHQVETQGEKTSWILEGIVKAALGICTYTCIRVQTHTHTHTVSKPQPLLLKTCSMDQQHHWPQPYTYYLSVCSCMYIKVSEELL